MNRQNIHTLNTLKCALPHTPTNTQMHTHPYKWTSDLCASLVSSLNLDILLLDSFHFFSRSAHAYVVHLLDCARLIKGTRTLKNTHYMNTQASESTDYIYSYCHIHMYTCTHNGTYTCSHKLTHARIHTKT